MASNLVAQSQKEKKRVASVSEIPAGQHKLVNIGNIEIGIYNIRDEFFALKSVCPHQRASLCKGVVTGTNLPSQVGKYIYGREGEIVRCPWHNWEFDIKTGKALCDQQLRVATYKVSREGDELFVQM
jgi:nitrite reductase (NADH) small subunit